MPAPLLVSSACDYGSTFSLLVVVGHLVTVHVDKEPRCHALVENGSFTLSPS